MFDHILNWKLLKGSHEFPGPNGGTCINEAAIIAAGFEYRKVESWKDCPPCFSIPISAYALALNDLMPDYLRQKLLLPFVTRLAGTDDKPEIEAMRINLIVSRTRLEIIGSIANATNGAIADFIAVMAADAAANATTIAAVADIAAFAACNAANASNTTTTTIWETTVSILDEAICIGNQTKPIERELVIKRMEAAKQLEKI